VETLEGGVTINSLRSQESSSCSDLITSGRLLDYIAPFQFALRENRGTLLLTFTENILGFRLLASFGETGSFGGCATCSRPPEGRENRVVADGKFVHAPRGGSRALDFTKDDQDPGFSENNLIISVAAGII
jgi:hypothetical protein